MFHVLRCFDKVRVGKTAHGRIVAVRAAGPGSATRVRRMAVASGRNVVRAAHPGRPGIEATRANETMIRVVVVFVGRACLRREPVTTGRRPEAPEGAFRGMSMGAGSGSDGRREALRGKGC